MEQRVRRLWWAGLSGILGGLLLLATAVLLPLAAEAQVLGWTGDDHRVVGPIGFGLVWVAQRGLHRVHLGRSNGLERWGSSMLSLGLLLLAVGQALRLVATEPAAGEDPTLEHALPIALNAFGVILMLPGLVLQGIGIQRARVMPIWTGPLLVLTALAAIVRYFDESIVNLYGAGWVLVGVTLLLTPAPEPEPADPRLSLQEVRRAFLSRATLISGVIAVGVWSIEWSWIVGLFVVLLLYGHEIGHVLAAFWRGVQVKRAPMFLPGLGAFVETAPGASAWDDVWVSLGGPLFGGACALAVKLAGIQNGSPELAHAGDFALLVNAINMAPFSPLDGGHVARRTGWLGVLLTLGLGVWLLIEGVGLLFSVLIILSGLHALATVRRTGTAFRNQLGIFGVYLVATLVLFSAKFGSGDVMWLPSGRPDWVPSLSTIFEFVLWVWIASLVALPIAFRPDQTALVRYGIAALVGWPRYLLDRRAWMSVVSFALLGEALGLPGAAWTRGYVSRLAQRNDAAGGAAAAYGFDALVRKGDPKADIWLDSMLDTLRAGGPAVLSSAFDTLRELGYDTAAKRTLDRRFVADDATSTAYQAALGLTLLEERHDSDAERALRAGLVDHDTWRTRVALARSLARQERFAEAIEHAKVALARAPDASETAPPSRDELRDWCEQWRRLAGIEPDTAGAAVLRSNVDAISQ